MNVHALWWMICYILLHLRGNFIVQHYRVKRPLLVSCDLLLHRCQETLWVKEASHPKAVRLAREQPSMKLRVTV